MKFLAIDTSGRRLTVVAVNGEREVVRDLDCAMRHSVVLMDEIDAALSSANLKVSECDFIACVVGPGSFTGIRIGISTVKGLCFAGDIPVLAVTSFDCLAYAETGKRTLALVDAGHDCYYACGYEGTDVRVPPAYRTREQVEKLLSEGYTARSYEALALQTETVSAAKGLALAARELANGAAPAKELAALYLRKSSAEEKR